MPDLGLSIIGGCDNGGMATSANRTPRNDETGEVIELETTAMAHGGIAVARHEGRVVFVSDTMPGERVLARVSEKKSKFWRAETVEVLEASEHRVPHIWPEADVSRKPAERVGGADYGHIGLDYQRQLKREVIEDAFRRTAKIDLTPFALQVRPVPGDRDGLGYRTRVTLQVKGGKVGPFAARTHTIVPVTSLPLAAPEINRSAPLDAIIPDAETLDLVLSGGDVAIYADVVEGESGDTITERVGEREFQLDALGFWQVHRGAPELLTSEVQNALDDTLFDPAAANHDLYGGVGLLAAAMADRFGPSTKVTSVEADERATDFAAENLSEWIGARAITATVGRYLRDAVRTAGPQERERWRRASVVLDPPRSGAGREVIASLVDLAPAQIVYVACDPVALARDAGFLEQAGYRMRSLRAFDLFPHTHHVECVAAFTRES